MFIACEDKDPVTSGSDEYTVIFEANGGSPAPQNQTISHGGKVTEPAPITKTGYDFGGWYKEAAFINLWNFTTDVVTGNITLYAKWDINYYIVNFEANGGYPVPEQQNIVYNGKVIKPQDMSKEDYLFEGWYKEAAFINLWNFNIDTVTRDITLCAKWGQPVIVQGTTLTEKLQWLNSNAANYGTYIIEVNNDEYLIPHTLSYSGKSNITIQLIGIGGVKTIELNGSDRLFTIGNGVTLVLNENIVLIGSVNAADGNLIMNNGSKISGGRVYISDGTFTMNGGEISGNTASSSSYSYGGGVSVDGGTFTMNGGKISDNTASSYFDSCGGGVYISNGTFTMTGGEIYDNTAYANSSSSYSSSYGGGVYISNGTFTMTGGEISGNTASVYNSVSDSYGGGVYISNGTFTMTGGEISGNTASASYSCGGGVYVTSNSRFEKTGGIITGYSSDTENGNVVKNNDGTVENNSGHAVYVGHDNYSFVRRKETTAGQGDNLIYIRNEPNPPTIIGAWDN